MGTAERRTNIIRILCRRKHETISNLANEFGVSTRTIQRDIEVLGIAEPIYTQCGRYDGGVYIAENYDMSIMYMTDTELSVLHKLELLAENKAISNINEGEHKILRKIITQYSKPKIRK